MGMDIQDIYIANSTLNKIIAHLKYDASINDSALISEYTSNIGKKITKMYQSIGLSKNVFANGKGGKKIYPLEAAAILITFFLYKSREEKSFPFMIMKKDYTAITGNQLVAYLDLASEISLVLYQCAGNYLKKFHGTTQYMVEEKNEYLWNVCSELKKVVDSYQKNGYQDYEEFAFMNKYYEHNSNKFNELVMLANIKGQNEDLICDISELPCEFLNLIFYERKTRNTSTDIFDALRPIDLPENFNELDAHTMICEYNNKMSNYSRMLCDALKVMTVIIGRADFVENYFNEKSQVFDSIVKYFESVDGGKIIYDSIVKKYGHEEGYKKLLDLCIKRFCKK